MNTSSKIRYLDTSVAMRILLNESPTAEKWIADDSDSIYLSSRLLEAELVRNYKRMGKDLSEIERVTKDVLWANVDNELVDEAAALEPVIKTLDAMHLATALRLAKSSHVTVITHDAQMSRAAKELGLEVIDPVTDDPNRAPVA